VTDTRVLILPLPPPIVRPFLTRPVMGCGAILGRLFTSLADVLCELDDLTALRGAVASVGVHKARAAVASLWPGALVALTSAPSRGCNNQSGRPRLLMAAVLLLLFAILGDSSGASRLGDSSLWCRVPCTALGSSGALVGQSEESGDSFHVMCG
jgi:hypothetical protein